MGQLNRAIKASGVSQHKSSKRAGVEDAKEILANKGLAPTKHNIALHTGVHSSGTYDNYYSIGRMYFRYMSENHQSIKNLDDVSRKSAEGFLRTAAAKNIKLDTYNNYQSALTKIQQVLNHHYESKGIEKTIDFDKAKAFVQTTKEYSELERDVAGRSYQDPVAVVEALEREDHKLVAMIQLEAGARVNEASLIDDKRLGGLAEHTGKEVGVIHLKPGDAKGGMERDIYLPRSTYEKVEAYVREHGQLHVGKGYERDVYREAIKQAAEANGQKYTGSHGLRHNYAQNRMEELRSQGMGESAAKTTVSVEMGHFREDITDHYLKT